MLGMIGALLVIWVGFDIYSGILRPGDGLFGGSFLTPRNLWILLVQTSSIAVMTTGMVLVIVMRQIDLSVGSMLGFVAVIIGTAAGLLAAGPGLSGWPSHDLDHHPDIRHRLLAPSIGAFHGTLIAYAGIPSFIVTLGGLIVWRGAAWAVIRGETVAPMDKNFKLIGGGFAGTTPGSIGATASWTLGFIACAACIAGILNGRRQRQRFKFPLRPVWAETSLAVVGCIVALGATWLVNSYPWPKGVVDRYAVEKAITVPPEGLFISHGYAVPVLIAIGIGALMTFLATRTRFGRYVYATGGNPGSSRTGRYQHQETDGHDLRADGRTCRRFGLDLVGAPRLGHQCAGPVRRALCHCRRCYRRHVAGRWPRHHLWRHAGGPGHAVAAVGHDTVEF